MTRPHPLTALSEREWAQAWEAEQRAMDALESRRGSWLPNVIEPRDWGALRWTSGRPAHAASTGQAAAETYVVFRPELTDRAIRNQIMSMLRDRPPVRRMLGFGLREHHVKGAIQGSLVGGVVTAGLSAVLGVPALFVLVAAVVGAVAGAVVGVAILHYRFTRNRADVLGNTRHLRLIKGRYAPPAWTRLVEAATLVGLQSTGRNEADAQSREAVHVALWEAADLLLTSSDHTGVAVLAEGVERLAKVDRG